MNLYFLVEGDDEAFIYPEWLAYLRPELQPVKEFDKVMQNHYYLFNAKGYPRVLHEALPAAIADVNSVGNYDYLVVCFDADEDTVVEREQQVREVLQANLLSRPTQIRIIIQNRCLETWLLGNQVMYPDNPTNNELKEFLNFYHAGRADPELMGNPKTIYKHYHSTHARFHKRYFQVLLDEQGIKKVEQLAETAKVPYLSELQKRITVTPTHLQTFQTFIDFCQRITL